MPKKTKKKHTRNLIVALLLIIAGVLLFFVMGYLNNSTEGESTISQLNNEKASVHDPSIIKEKDGEMYYAFGTHIDAAKSPNLIEWSNFTNGYDTPENTLYGDLSENLSESFEWAGENDSDSIGGYAVWAPDVFWNENFINKDGSKGAYMMYYSVSSTYIRSAIGIAVSQNIEGTYEYFDTIMYSGFHNEEAYDTNSKVNKHWKNTNINQLLNDNVIEDINYDWFTSSGEYNNKMYPNALDPNILYDKNGDLWMIYGSWSGGIYALELNKETGRPIYPETDGQTADGRMIDRYFGTKIAAGYGRSAEGPYVSYNKDSDYYYLYLSYGGLASDGGYQIRQFRSRNIDGPYEDAIGNKAVFSEEFDRGIGNFPGNSDHKEIGNKLMGNFLFEQVLGEENVGSEIGYLAPGHNSILTEETGKMYLVFHTRFPQEGEMHELKIHQMFMNSNGWPVVAPYSYGGEELKEVRIQDVLGDYEYINHEKDISSNVNNSEIITLNDNNEISGSISGRWRQLNNNNIEVTIDGEIFTGIFVEQINPTTEEKVMTFTALSDNGKTIWGSQIESIPNEEANQ